MLLVRCNIFYESLHYPSSVLLSRQAEMQDENTGCLCFTDQPSCGRNIFPPEGVPHSTAKLSVILRVFFFPQYQGCLRYDRCGGCIKGIGCQILVRRAAPVAPSS